MSKIIKSVVLRDKNDDDVLYVGKDEVINNTKYSVHVNFDKSVKESHECNSGLISKKKLIEDINDNLFTVNTQEYGNLDVIDIDNLVDIINNQPQVQPIVVRSAEEIINVTFATDINCESCLIKSFCNKKYGEDSISSAECKQVWHDWLTKKEV